MVKYVLLHYAIGDNVVAFRHIAQLIGRNPHVEIQLLFNEQTQEFMNYWEWPSNVKLVPLKPLLHDIDNLVAFPYETEGKTIKTFNGHIGTYINEELNEIAKGFAAFDGVTYLDYRPLRVRSLPPQHDRYIWSYTPERPFPNLVKELDSYIVIQPMSTSHTLRFEKSELEIYENWLKTEMISYFNYFNINCVFVGTKQDAEVLPNLAALPSTDTCKNLIGKTSIVELCDIIQHSKGIWGISSAAINIGDYLLGKPVLSWNLWDRSIELFDSFLHHHKSLAINRPWLKTEDFYLNYIKNFKILMNPLT